jgi:hypothetical protein
MIVCAALQLLLRSQTLYPAHVRELMDETG